MLKDMKMAERSTSKKALQQTTVLARGAKSKEDAPNAPGWFNPDYLNPVVIPANDSDPDQACPAPPCPARKASSECKKLCSPRQNPAEAAASKSKRQRHKNYKCRRSSSSWGPRTAQHSNWPQSLDDLIPRDPHRISDSEANIITASLSKKQLKSNNKKKDSAGASPRKQHSNDSIPNHNKPPSRNSGGKWTGNADHRQRISPPSTSTKSVTPPSTRTSPLADCSSLFPSLKSSPTSGGGDRRKSGASIRLLSTKLSHTNLPTCANQSVKIAHKFSDTKLLNFSDPTKLARQLTAVIPKEKMAMNVGGQNGGDAKSLIESPEINPFKPTPFFEAIQSPVVLENLEIKKFNISTPFFERKSSLESLDANKKALATDSDQHLDKSHGDHQADFQESTVPTTSNTKMATEPKTLNSKTAIESKTLNAKMAPELAANPARQSPRNNLRDKTPRGIQDGTLKSPARSPCQALSKLSCGKKSKALDLIPSLSGRRPKAETSHEKPASESLSSTTIILSSTTTTILNTTLVVQQQSKATTCDSCGKAVQVTNVQPMPPSANSTGPLANFQEIPSEMPQDIPSGPSAEPDGFASASTSKSESDALDKWPKAEHSKSAPLHQDDQLLHKDPAPIKEDEEEEDEGAKNKLVWVPTSFFNRMNKKANGALAGQSSLERTPDLISGGAAIKCKSEESEASLDSNSTFILHAGESVSMESAGPGASSSDTAIQLGETQYFLPLITHDEEKFFGCIRPVRRGDRSRREISPPQFVKANKSRMWKSIECEGGGGVTNTRITTCAATAVLTSSTRSFNATRRRKGPRILKLLAPPITSSASPVGSAGRNCSSSAQPILLLPAGSEVTKESPSKSSNNNDHAELSKFQLDPIFAFRIPSFELVPLQRIEDDDEYELRDSSVEEQREDWGRCEGSWNIIDLITPSTSTDLRAREEMRGAAEVVLDLSEYRKPAGSPPFPHNLAQYCDDAHLVTGGSTQPEQESSSSNKFTTSVIPSASDSTNPSGWSKSSNSSSSSTSYYNSQARLKCKNSNRRCLHGWKLSRFCHPWSHVCLRKVTFSRHFRSLFPSCCSSSKPNHDSSRSSSSIIQLY